MLSEDTQFVLANAVLFRGTWLMEFDAAATAEGVFHAPDGPRHVQMMTAEKEFPVARLYQLNARALLMPYKVRRHAAAAGGPGDGGLLPAGSQT